MPRNYFSLSVIKLLLILMISISGLKSQSQFKGKLIYAVQKNESELFYQYAALSQKKEPYSRYLNSRVEYTINNDTLILEQYDELGELYFVNIQIGNQVYALSPNNGIDFVNVSSYDVDICLIENWEKNEKNELVENNEIRYRGYAIQNKITTYDIKILDNKEYPQQMEYGGLFCKIFAKYGLITESLRTFQDDTTYMILEEKLQEENVNCREKIEEYGFEE